MGSEGWLKVPHSAWRALTESSTPLCEQAAQVLLLGVVEEVSLGLREVMPTARKFAGMCGWPKESRVARRMLRTHHSTVGSA